jgi:hypothetical protein
MIIGVKGVYMKQKENEQFYLDVQSFFKLNPKVFIGSGLSVSLGLPGMWSLKEYLKIEVPKAIGSNTELIKCWHDIIEKIELLGLESGLDSAVFNTAIVDIITRLTADLIHEHDIKFKNEVFNTDDISKYAISTLIRKLCSSCSNNIKSVDIMTTNYDNIIEYICDMNKIPIINGFNGKEINMFTPELLSNHNRNRSIHKYVRIFKPHGSIDWYEKNGVIFELKDENLGKSLKRVIVTPGMKKYEMSLTNSIFLRVREMFNGLLRDPSETKALLIFGYGFNDEHFNVILDEAITNCEKVIIISKEIKYDIQKKYLLNKNVIMLFQGDQVNYVTYKSQRYEVKEEFWDLNTFINDFLD